ncbi:MAG: FIST signal transduction protein [Planktomarina sp.]
MNDLVDQIKTLDAAPDLVALHGSCDLDYTTLIDMSGDTAVHGATSCRGVMTDFGHQTKEGHGAGAFCIFDPDGDYGTGIAHIGEDPALAGKAATLDALKMADRIGEAPQLIWLSVTPGAEELVIEGIQSVVGKNTPILGGSAADNDISGQWIVADRKTHSQNGVVVSVLFPSTRISFAYQNGYTPTKTTGVITKADVRKVLEIGDKPAGDVYMDWTNNLSGKVSPEGTHNILSEATFAPIGRDAFEIKGVPYYLLAHPSAKNDDGSLDLFAELHEGEVITLMEGSPAELAARPGRVTSQAQNAGNFQSDDLAGALVVFCGGCMLGVQDRMDDVIQGMQTAVPDLPFLGVFTFGEQGPLLGKGNKHGNLMISAITFSKLE